MIELISDIKIKENQILLCCKLSEDRKKGIFGLFSSGEDIAEKNLEFALSTENHTDYDTVVVKIPLNEFMGWIGEELGLHLDEVEEYLK